MTASSQPSPSATCTQPQTLTCTPLQTQLHNCGYHDETTMNLPHEFTCEVTYLGTVKEVCQEVYQGNIYIKICKIATTILVLGMGVVILPCIAACVIVYFKNCNDNTFYRFINTQSAFEKVENTEQQDSAMINFKKEIDRVEQKAIEKKMIDQDFQTLLQCKVAVSVDGNANQEELKSQLEEITNQRASDYRSRNAWNYKITSIGKNCLQIVKDTSASGDVKCCANAIETYLNDQICALDSETHNWLVKTMPIQQQENPSCALQNYLRLLVVKRNPEIVREMYLNHEDEIKRLSSNTTLLLKEILHSEKPSIKNHLKHMGQSRYQIERQIKNLYFLQTSLNAFSNAIEELQGEIHAKHNTINTLRQEINEMIKEGANTLGDDLSDPPQQQNEWKQWAKNNITTFQQNLALLRYISKELDNNGTHMGATPCRKTEYTMQCLISILEDHLMQYQAKQALLQEKQRVYNVWLSVKRNYDQTLKQQGEELRDSLPSLQTFLSEKGIMKEDDLTSFTNLETKITELDQDNETLDVFHKWLTIAGKEQTLPRNDPLQKYYEEKCKYKKATTRLRDWKKNAEKENVKVCIQSILPFIEDNPMIFAQIISKLPASSLPYWAEVFMLDSDSVSQDTQQHDNLLSAFNIVWQHSQSLHLGLNDLDSKYHHSEYIAKLSMLVRYAQNYGKKYFKELNKITQKCKNDYNYEGKRQQQRAIKEIKEIQCNGGLHESIRTKKRVSV